MGLPGVLANDATRRSSPTTVALLQCGKGSRAEVLVCMEAVADHPQIRRVDLRWDGPCSERSTVTRKRDEKLVGAMNRDTSLTSYEGRLGRQP